MQTMLDRSIDFVDDAVRTSYTNTVVKRSNLPAAISQRGPDPMWDIMRLMGVSDTHSQQYRHFRGWPFAAIRAIGMRMGGVPFNLGRTVGTPQQEASFVFGNQKGIRLSRLDKSTRPLMPSHVSKRMQMDEVDRIVNHDLINAMAQPNSWMTQWQLVFVTVASFELTGKSYWVHGDFKGKYEIYYIPADWMTPIHKAGPFSHFAMRKPTSAAEPVEIPRDNVLYMSLPDPGDPKGATSQIEANRLTIESDESMQNAMRASFDNDMTPGMVLRVGRLPGMPSHAALPILSPHQRAQLLDAVLGHYESVLNHREPLIVDGMISGVDRLASRPHEMDYGESSKIPKSRILQTFGVNQFVLGEMESANRATAAAAEQSLVDGVINPLFCLLGQSMSGQMGHVVDEVNPQTIVMWFDLIHARDRELRIREWTQGGRLGNITMDEFRVNILGLEPLKNNLGRMMVVPKNMSLLDSDTGEIVDPGEQQQVREAMSRQKGFHPSCVDLTKAKKVRASRVMKLFTEQEQKHRSKLENVLFGYFNEWAKEFADAVARGGHVDVSVLEEHHSDKNIKRDLQELSLPVLAQAAAEGASTELEFVRRTVGGRVDGGGTEPLNTRILDEIRGEIEDRMEEGYWDEVVRNHEEDNKKLLLLLLGVSAAEAASKIREEIGNRRALILAKLMSVTETGGAINMGHQAAMNYLERQGFEFGKMWLSARIPTSRDGHVALHGVVTVPATNEGLFTLVGRSGEYRTPYPHWSGLPAEELVNCLCSIISDVVVGEIDALP